MVSNQAKSFLKISAKITKIRAFLKKKLYYAGISQILIERTAKKLRVTVVAARPGIIIGKKGQDVENLKNEVSKLIGKEVNVNIKRRKKSSSFSSTCC